MLEPEITQLAMAVRSAVEQLRETNSIATQKRVRVKRRDFNLKYVDDFGFANFGPERSEVVWEWQDEEKFLSGFLRESKEFSILNAALGLQASRLESFVRDISFQAYHGLEDQELRARANALACELEGKPLPVTVTAFIDGLSISEPCSVFQMPSPFESRRRRTWLSILTSTSTVGLISR